MYRAFFEQILTKIGTDLPQFKKTGMFANDFDKMDDGTATAINFPAIFVSVPDNVEYEDGGSGVQRTGEFIVRLVIGDKFLTDKNILDIFDMKQDVYEVFNGFQPTGASGLRRIAERTDEDRNGYYIFEQDYIVNLIDTSTYIRNKRTAVLLEDFVITGEVSIDPNTDDNFRTNKKT